MNQPIQAASARHLFAAAMAAAFATAPLAQAAAPGAPLGLPLAVFDELAANQAAPRVARAADGRFAVVWTDAANGGLMARRFAPDGAPLDGGFRITEADPRSEIKADVAIDAAGGLFVVWNADGVQGRRYRPDGVPAGPAFAVEPNRANAVSHGQPAVAIDADGDAVVAWERGTLRFDRDLPNGVGGYAYHNDVSLHQRQIAVQRFDRNGQPVGARIVAGQRPDLTLRYRPFVVAGIGTSAGLDIDTSIPTGVDVAIDADGDFAVAWSARTEGFAYFSPSVFLLGVGVQPQTTALYLRRYAVDGRPLTPPKPLRLGLGVLSFPDTEIANPSIAMNATGGLVVAWSEQSRAVLWTDRRHRVRLFDTDGEPVGPPLLLADDVPDDSLVRTAIAADGRAAVVRDSGLREISEVPVRFLGPGRRGFDSEFFASVADSERLRNLRPDLAMDAAGSLAVVWTEVRRRDPAPAPLVIEQLIRYRLFAAP